MSETMKGCLLACGLSLPIFIGVGWLADIITRGFVAAVMISKGADPAAFAEPILPAMIPSLLMMWVGVSAICVGLAAIGLGSVPKPPAPPPFTRP